jgi:RND family efflux transporter MFP subunit
MATILRGRFFVISAILLCMLDVGYRIYESKSDGALLREKTLKGAVLTVAVTNATPMALTETITLPGTIAGWYEAPIYARVTGYVKMWYRGYGDQVKKGDILAEINAPDLDAEYAQAKAGLEKERARYKLAEVTAKRWVALRPNHSVSEQSITAKEQELKVHAALLKESEQKVRNIDAFITFKTIVAPFDGWVIQRNINVGDFNAKTNLFTVAVVDRLRLFVSVPETFGPFLQPGLTADVTVPQLPNRHFTAKFLTVARGFDVSTRTAVTVFTLDNKDRALWPGSYAQVHLTAPVDRQAFTMPSTALVFQEHGTQVAVVTEDNRVHYKPIIVSKLLDATVEAAEGIATTDRIVNNPSAALLEGDKVRIVTPAAGYDLVGKGEPSHALVPSPQQQEIPSDLAQKENR